MDDERLKRGGSILSDRYFEQHEQHVQHLQRVREIRLWERKFYQKKRGLEHRNLAVELLPRLINDEVKMRRTGRCGGSSRHQWI